MSTNCSFAESNLAATCLPATAKTIEVNKIRWKVPWGYFWPLVVLFGAMFCKSASWFIKTLNANPCNKVWTFLLCDLKRITQMSLFPSAQDTFSSTSSLEWRNSLSAMLFTWTKPIRTALQLSNQLHLSNALDTPTVCRFKDQNLQILSGLHSDFLMRALWLKKISFQSQLGSSLSLHT